MKKFIASELLRIAKKLLSDDITSAIDDALDNFPDAYNEHTIKELIHKPVVLPYDIKHCSKEKLRGYLKKSKEKCNGYGEWIFNNRESLKHNYPGYYDMLNVLYKRQLKITAEFGRILCDRFQEQC